MSIRVLGDRKRIRYDESLIDRVNAMYSEKIVPAKEKNYVKEKNIVVPSGFEVFEGKPYVQLMPEIADKDVFLGMNGIMKRRVSGSEDEKKYFKNRSFDTVDAYVANSGGRFKIVFDCDILKDVNTGSILVDGGLLIVGVYDNLSGVAFSASDRKYANRALTEIEAKKDPFWLALARNDQELLDQYVEEFFKFLKDVKKEDKGMQVFLPKVLEVSCLRAWCLGRFDRIYGKDGSPALGGCSLDNDNENRLIRVVAQEAQK